MLRQNLEDILMVIAAARREQTRDIIAVIRHLQDVQYRFPPGMYRHAGRTGTDGRTGDVMHAAANWRLEDEFLTTVFFQPPPPHYRADDAYQ